MVYQFEICDSIKNVNIQDWNLLKEGANDIFMDPRFITALENAMGDQCQFRYIIFYDEENKPVASTCISSVFSHYKLETSTLDDGLRKKIIHMVNKVAPTIMCDTIVLCGLPLSGIENHLRFTKEVRHAEVLKLLDEILLKFAKKVKATTISFKDLLSEECLNLESLKELGYRRADTPQMHHVNDLHADFNEYLMSVTSNKRIKIKRSLKKFNKDEIRVEFLQKKDGADKLYTKDVHIFYETLFERSDLRLEKMPRQLYPEIFDHLPDETYIMYIFKDERIVAFCMSIVGGENYHLLYGGYDHELNSEYDLYFNIFYQMVDHASKLGVKKIIAGQTADFFKRDKLGTVQLPVYCYVKGANPLARFVIRYGFNLLFPKRYNTNVETSS